GSMVVEGNMYAQGSISLNGGCVNGNIWAGGGVNLQNVITGGCTGSTYPTGYSITNDSPPNPICNGQGPNTCYFQDSSGTALGSVTAAGGSLALSSTKAYGTCVSSASMSWTNSSSCSPNRDNTGYSPASCTGT